MPRLTKAAFFLLILFYSCKQITSDDVIRVNASQAKDFSVLIKDRLNGRRDGKIQIEFKKGTYHFYPDQAVEEYMKISNNDNGNKKIAFPLFHYAEVEIDGNGSDFIFHGGIIPFGLSGLKSAQLKILMCCGINHSLLREK
ncbi:MAG: hypothetical protein IPN33_12230 [Saprospiraceae bacterium]|nr:hypothetical protein [Saprospiraceae bacterium]